jgi:hypothetical protein
MSAPHYGRGKRVYLVTKASFLLVLVCWQECSDPCTCKKEYLGDKRNLNLMSTMEEHWVIKDLKGGHNSDKVLLGEIVLFLFLMSLITFSSVKMYWIH